LDRHVGDQIVAMNQLIRARMRSRDLIVRFGPRHGRYRASIVTTLRGDAGQIVPWLALTCDRTRVEDDEFIVVVTDADLFEPAMRAARVAEATLGVPLTLVLRSGGDAADTGGDAALSAAQSGRLIFMDQTVLPREPDWMCRHAALLDGMPAEQTRLFGGMLFQPDGALCHGGYCFDRATYVLGRSEPPRQGTILRLKAIGHPAPAAGVDVLDPRRVACVPAAFLSVDRAWFEKLGGFTGDYLNCVYEDVDLCLRSLQRGVSPWVHSLPMWYFSRQPPPRPQLAKGGVLFNDWLMHQRWAGLIESNLLSCAVA